ncbi:MAG: hypothetical protein K0Q74_928 [Gammaproteobacteria bacterium]|jgi:type IV pilus assembly protein PilV|nr:hypothetical protein [Gammaproteobacteria bacterium]
MKGFSLLEVILALLILSVGLLAIAGMQLSGIKYTDEAYFRSLAATQLSSMMERLRANRSNNWRERDFQRWNTLNAELLPEGEGRYICQNDYCTVYISWKFNKIQTLSLSGDV